jgi:hypothetical protein
LRRLGIVIAWSVRDEAIQGNVRPRRSLDCFASLAMTGLVPPKRNML